MQILEILVSPEIITNIYGKKRVELNLDCPVNSYLVLRSNINNKDTALVRYLGDGTVKRIRSSRSLAQSQISPRDAKQASFIDSLLEPSILLNVAIGTAGTGKTTLAIAYAAQQYLNNKTPIFLAKSTVTVGPSRAFGAVPGDIREKYDPYLKSYMIVMKKVFGAKSDNYFQVMEQQKHLEYIPLELARGCTFENCTFILDEAQNLTWHELNTIVSRMGENTKLIVLGDLNQIDVRLSREETGLYKFIHSEGFKSSPIACALELTTQYRSPITQLVASIDNELRNKNINTNRNRKKGNTRAARTAAHAV